VEHGASENPPLDVTLRSYGARPSVAAYVLNSPDEIQGDLFSFVVKRPNVTVAEVSKLAQDMMQSYMEMTSSRGLPSGRQLGSGIKVYLKLGDWTVVELLTPAARREFEERLSGEGWGGAHYLEGSKFTVFGFIDESGGAQTFVEVARTKSGRPPYYVVRIAYGQRELMSEEVLEKLQAFFEHERASKQFHGLAAWAAVTSKYNFEGWNGHDNTGLCGTSLLRADDRFDVDSTQWAEEVNIAIADAIYMADEFGLHRQIFGLVPSQLFRAADCLIGRTKLEIFQIEGICKTVATAFAVRDEAHAIFEQLDAVEQGEALYTEMPHLSSVKITALSKYLNSKAGNNSAYAWLERYYEQHLSDLYTEDKGFLTRVYDELGTPPNQAHYSGRDTEYARDRKEWDEQKQKLGTEWVKTHFPYVLFVGVINEYKELTSDRVDWSGT